MKLILSGGGSGEQTKELDTLFANLLDKNKPLLYIPIAIDNIKFPYDGCLKWLKSTFDKFGVKSYKMIIEGDLDKIDIKNYSGVYLGGGNTPYLLKKLKTSKIWAELKKAIKKDIPIYGASAGAIIFSKSIKPSLNFDKNWVELKNLEGMNLINNNYLFCHFTDNKKEKIKDIIIKEDLDSSIALTEKNGLLITKDAIRVVGQESAWLFDKLGNKKKLNVGKIVPFH